ncbi:MAG: endonuclease/exonuclease/phosphatase family protein, partial [Panacibacter sp.]
MKKILMLCLLMNTLIAFAQSPLNVMTFNIRYNNTEDSLNAWPYRKDIVASQVLFYNVHLLGVQEALNDQMMDLQERLQQYKTFGGGRDDGKTKGEFSAIFYDTARLQKLDGAMFWLSQTPTVPGSKGWDAAITRMVTWCKFKDLKTKKIFFAFNTHFDHIGKIARAESAKLVLQKVKEIAQDVPVIFTGDFNATPSDEPIKIITGAANPDHLTDSKAVSQTPHYGPSGTFTGFESKEKSNEPIDHIFIKNHVRVLKHATLSESWQGRFSSDHF